VIIERPTVEFLTKLLLVVRFPRQITGDPRLIPTQSGMFPYIMSATEECCDRFSRDHFALILLKVSIARG
jgi:hypothetical protein